MNHQERNAARKLSDGIDNPVQRVRLSVICSFTFREAVWRSRSTVVRRHPSPRLKHGRLWTRLETWPIRRDQSQDLDLRGRPHRGTARTSVQEGNLAESRPCLTAQG